MSEAVTLQNVMLNRVQHQYQNVKFYIVFTTFDLLNNFTEQNKIDDYMFILSSGASRSNYPNNFYYKTEL